MPMEEKKVSSKASGVEVKGELEQIVELSMLYDFYGALLKDHKQKIFEDYVLNDYSLSEIAKEEGMTRQGVHDLVKRCSRELREYETKLHLLEKFEHTRNRVACMQKVLYEMKEHHVTEQKLNELITLSCEILDEI